MFGEPCETSKAAPLRVVAHLAESIALTRPLALDGLLCWAVSAEHRLLPPVPGQSSGVIEIPIMREPEGRFHLCSEGFSVPEHNENRYKHRRAPVAQFHRFGKTGKSGINRVDTAAGANKSYRAPYVLQLMQGDQIEWWCLGDPERIRLLLGHVRYLGKHRGSGKGRLDIHGVPWTVERCAEWPGFPVVRGGKPLRPLPLDWPGLESPNTSWRVLAPPYWDRSREELLACP